MGLAGTNLTGSLPDSWAAPGEAPRALQASSCQAPHHWGILFFWSNFVKSLFLHLVMVLAKQWARSESLAALPVQLAYIPYPE